MTSLKRARMLSQLCGNPNLKLGLLIDFKTFWYVDLSFSSGGILRGGMDDVGLKKRVVEKSSPQFAMGMSESPISASQGPSTGKK